MLEDLTVRIVTMLFYLISLLGVAVVVWGVAEAVIRFLTLLTGHRGAHAKLVRKTARIRERLGAHLLLALDIFIGADIIKSVIAPAWEHIAMLGAVVLIRVVLSYFLEREMERTHQSAQSGRLSDHNGEGE
ncbi:DUF1622 domain-containing protein [Marinobacter sp. LQ44]|uniref:DUF1622 domain-containing protein n=1 Tax=unclassified Marinobacter TaxID=83889 RepID=UPI000718B1EE|nr:DUF1622 domain-containing protein [Marinobacter sp. LQ44]AMQ88027.1 hypothetical protein ASQ50_04660 [Marinobacter sp. LQ44]